MHLVAPDGSLLKSQPKKKERGNKHEITHIFTFAKGLLYLRQNMKIGPLPFLQLGMFQLFLKTHFHFSCSYQLRAKRAMIHHKIVEK